jgi:hypothetical protein
LEHGCNALSPALNFWRGAVGSLTAKSGRPVRGSGSQASIIAFKAQRSEH